MRTTLTILAALALCLPAFGQDHSDDPYQGAWLTPGTTVAGAIEKDSDRDWFRIRVETGETYGFETSNLTGGMDSVIALFGTDGRRVGYDDDGGSEQYASKIDWRATGTGTAYFVVLHYSDRGRGAYRLRTTGPGSGAGAPPVRPTPQPQPPPTSGNLISAPAVFDPKLGGAALDLTYRLGGSGARPVAVRVLDGSGRAVATVASSSSQAPGQTASARWDGRLSGGSLAGPGSYRLVLESNGTRLAEQALAIVRLGASRIEWTGSGRVGLLFHRADPGRLRSYLALDAFGASWTLATSDGTLDDSRGSALASPAVHTDTKTPPRTSSGQIATLGINLPVAYASGGARSIRLTLGGAAVAGGRRVSCGYPVSGTPIRVVVDGRPSGDISPGATVTVSLAPLTGAVGRRDDQVAVTFQYRDGSTWRDIPGRQPVVQRSYVLLRRPELARSTSEEGRAPYIPWLDTVDRVAAWSGGRADTDEKVMDVVTEQINGNQGLQYERQGGAPAYSDGYPQDSTFDLAAFDVQYYGRYVNCTDCANLVSVHARMVGVDAQNLYLGYNFALHYIKGIGWDFTNRVFYGGGHAFSFHNVATLSRGATIHDACLAVDGDRDPSRAPHQELLPTGLSFRQYHDALTPGSFQGRALDRSRIE